MGDKDNNSLLVYLYWLSICSEVYLKVVVMFTLKALDSLDLAHLKDCQLSYEPIRPLWSSTEVLLHLLLPPEIR